MVNLSSYASLIALEQLLWGTVRGTSLSKKINTYNGHGDQQRNENVSEHFDGDRIASWVTIKQALKMVLHGPPRGIYTDHSIAGGDSGNKCVGIIRFFQKRKRFS